MSAKEGQRQAALATSRVDLQRLDAAALWGSIQAEAEQLAQSEPLLSSKVPRDAVCRCGVGGRRGVVWLVGPGRGVAAVATEGTFLRRAMSLSRRAAHVRRTLLCLQHPPARRQLGISVASQPSLAKSMSFVLANKLASETILGTQLVQLFTDAYDNDPAILEACVADLQAVHERDPACETYIQCILFYKGTRHGGGQGFAPAALLARIPGPDTRGSGRVLVPRPAPPNPPLPPTHTSTGFQAIQSHRLTHWIWRQGRQALALAIQSRAAEVYSVDIHPAARLGSGIMFDHATGIVVGETAVIGDNVSILHHVTLGGSGTGRGRRHPTVGAERGTARGAGGYRRQACVGPARLGLLP